MTRRFFRTLSILCALMLAFTCVSACFAEEDLPAPETDRQDQTLSDQQDPMIPETGDGSGSSDDSGDIQVEEISSDSITLEESILEQNGQGSLPEGGSDSQDEPQSVSSGDTSSEEDTPIVVVSEDGDDQQEEQQNPIVTIEEIDADQAGEPENTGDTDDRDAIGGSDITDDSDITVVGDISDDGNGKDDPDAIDGSDITDDGDITVVGDISNDGNGKDDPDANDGSDITEDGDITVVGDITDDGNGKDDPDTTDGGDITEDPDSSDDSTDPTEPENDFTQEDPSDADPQEDPEGDPEGDLEGEPSGDPQPDADDREIQPEGDEQDIQPEASQQEEETDTDPSEDAQQEDILSEDPDEDGIIAEEPAVDEPVGDVTDEDAPEEDQPDTMEEPGFVLRLEEGFQTVYGESVKGNPFTVNTTDELGRTVLFKLSLSSDASITCRFDNESVDLTAEEDEENTEVCTYVFEKYLMKDQMYTITLDTEETNPVRFKLKIRNKPQEEAISEQEEDPEEETAETEVTEAEESDPADQDGDAAEGTDTQEDASLNTDADEEAETGETSGEEAADSEKEEDPGEQASEQQSDKQDKEENASGLPADLSAKMTVSWENGVPELNSVAHFEAILEGFDGIEYRLQLQESLDNESWTDVQDATDDHMDVLFTEENYQHFWRIKVCILSFGDGVSEEEASREE